MTDITIIIPSYNKEKYIAETLDSIFMQETTYAYHIIVADDCSTDKTIEIVKYYQEKYPNKITLLTSDKNQKLYKNVLRTYEITKTDYFCVLDPDDYWTDKHKIQKALDFLQKNKDYTIYMANTLMLLPDGTKKYFQKHNKMKDYSFIDFLQDKVPFGHTSSSIFRNVIFKTAVPSKMKNLITTTMEQSFRGDTFRNVLHLYYGKYHRVSEFDSIYRITEEGIWQGINEIEQFIINANALKDIWLYFDKKYSELLIRSYMFAKIANIEYTYKIIKIKKSEDRKKNIEKLENLKFFYKENKEFFNQNIYKNIKLQYKIMLYIFKKILKKLLKKLGYK